MRSAARSDLGPNTPSGEGDALAPAVTVVIPTRNRLAFLQEAVESVAAQELYGWQLVVVDDDSSDGTSPWLATLKDSRIEAVRCSAHLERSAARNLGLERARGQFVLFLDDDDRLDPRALKQLSAALDRRPDAFAAVGAKLVFDGRGHRRRSPHPRRPVTRSAWREVLAGWVAVTGQILFRTDHLREFGAFDTGLSGPEDQELWLRIGRDGLATFIPRVVLEQRTHGSSRDGPDDEKVEAQMREAFVGRIMGSDRRQAERIVSARSDLRRSVAAFDDDDFRLAARCMLHAARLSPALMWSPLIGPSLSASLGKALMGAALPRGTARRLHRRVHALRIARRKSPVAVVAPPAERTA